MRSLLIRATLLAPPTLLVLTAEALARSSWS